MTHRSYSMHCDTKVPSARARGQTHMGTKPSLVVMLTRWRQAVHVVCLHVRSQSMHFGLTHTLLSIQTPCRAYIRGSNAAAPNTAAWYQQWYHSRYSQSRHGWVIQAPPVTPFEPDTFELNSDQCTHTFFQQQQAPHRGSQHAACARHPSNTVRNVCAAVQTDTHP
jgi:hypothetical protein